jgi:putative FmdB family regulatory protein
MPRYDYRCPECETTFEVVRPSTERDAPGCPECGAETRRVFTPVGVVFKGSGFHATDYPSETSSNGAAAEAKSSDASPKSEGKPCPAAGSGESCGSCPAASDS